MKIKTTTNLAGKPNQFSYQFAYKDEILDGLHLNSTYLNGGVHLDNLFYQ
jgi:hypothetical protein